MPLTRMRWGVGGGLAMDIFFLIDDNIHKQHFERLNPCRSHSNDILCVCVCWRVGGQMPMCEETFKGGFRRF